MCKQTGENARSRLVICPEISCRGMGAEAENCCYEGCHHPFSSDASGLIFWQHWLYPPGMDMEFSFWEELIFGIGFTLGSIRDTVVRTSLWRFCATQLGPLDG